MDLKLVRLFQILLLLRLLVSFKILKASCVKNLVFYNTQSILSIIHDTQKRQKTFLPSAMFSSSGKQYIPAFLPRPASISFKVPIFLSCLIKLIAVGLATSMKSTKSVRVTYSHLLGGGSMSHALNNFRHQSAMEHQGL